VSTPAESRAGLIPADLDATLVLVRHGESEWITQGLFQGQGDSPLSALGRRQAGLLAQRLAEAARPPVLPVPRRPPTLVVHSPLGRTTETAAAIVAAFADPGPGREGVSIPARPDPGLLEIGQGEWEGLHGSVINERWGELLNGWRLDPLAHWAPGGESVPEVDRRARAGLSRILTDLAADQSSPRRRRSPVMGYAEEPGDDPWAVIVGHDGVFKVALLALLDLPLQRFWTLPFALCGITIVELRAGRPGLRLHNATDHLAEIETEAIQQLEEGRAETGAL
jgi:phosphoserine phosphatase